MDHFDPKTGPYLTLKWAIFDPVSGPWTSLFTVASEVRNEPLNLVNSRSMMGAKDIGLKVDR